MNSISLMNNLFFALNSFCHKLVEKQLNETIKKLCQMKVEKIAPNPTEQLKINYVICNLSKSQDIFFLIVLHSISSC